jgi:hypothetical protein
VSKTFKLLNIWWTIVWRTMGQKTQNLIDKCIIIKLNNHSDMENFFRFFPPLRCNHGSPVCSISFLKGESLLPEQNQAICGLLEAPEHESWAVKQVSNDLKLSNWRIYKIIKAKSTRRTFNRTW